MNERRSVLSQTLWFAMGILAGAILTVLVYLAINKFTMSVLIGALVGTIVSVGNFFFICVSLTNATEGEVDPSVAANKARGGYILRMAAIALILIVALRSWYCDTIATIVPLLLMRPVLMIEQFFMKSGDKK